MFRWGKLTVAVTSASVSTLFDKLADQDIPISDIQYIDDLNVHLRIDFANYQKLVKFAEKRGDQLKILEKSGMVFCANKLWKRPVLLLFAVFWIVLVMYLPTKILFIQVEGNLNVPTYEIISAAQQCGIRFGASRRQVKSEEVKNALLSEISALKWVGVNTKGCVAVISVAEGIVDNESHEKYLLSSIVAKCDSVVTDITVTSGNVLCKVGQAVRKGQVLVSGYTDCGFSVKTESSVGEIYGITRRNISAIAMDATVVRNRKVTETTNYSMQIGKNIIYLKKTSGILDPSCVKMYEKKDLTLPGGFILPVSFIRETVVKFDTEQNEPSFDNSFDWVKNSVNASCHNHMLAGRILQESVVGSKKDGCYILSGYYICKEMIGKICTEEIFDNNG